MTTYKKTVPDKICNFYLPNSLSSSVSGRFFSTTRYYGSKRRLLPWIYNHIKDIQFNKVLDGFGGTGSVSWLFKAMGKDVDYNDAFIFNSHIANTVLSNKIPMSKSSFADFVNNIYPQKGVIDKNFRGIYYKNTENRWLDGFMQTVLSSSINKKQLSLYMYTLFQACLKKRPFNIFHRANLNLRTNKNIIRNFGNVKTWERSFPELMVEAYDEVFATIQKNHGKIKVLPPSDISDIKSGYDLLYLDPPYMAINANSNDGYWKRYHFLEGICRYGEWDKHINLNTKIRSMPRSEKFSKWERRESFKEELYGLIEKHRSSIVALSYVAEAYPDEQDIVTFFRSVFSQVSVHSVKHTHALSKGEKTELLFIGTP